MAQATGPLARLLARRQETAVDRLSSGRTTNKRPGSGARVSGSGGLNPAQAAARSAQEAAAVRRVEQDAKEARIAAKALALSKGKAPFDGLS